MRSVRRRLLVATISMVLVACEADGSQAPESSQSSASATTSIMPSSAPSASVDLASLRWYEVRRLHDLEGLEERTLLFGSLGGTASGELALGSIQFDERQEGAEPFAWIDPQADGIFDGKAVVWGRDGNLGLLESVDLLSGETRPLVDTPDIIHVATADGSLTRVFFITAEETGEPTGLWVDDVSDEDGPEPISYDFRDQPIHTFLRYRLVASEDGSLLAVQRDEGDVTLVDVATGGSEDVNPGGPLVGFTDDHLVSLGGQSEGTAPVVAFDLADLKGATVFHGALAAQVVGRGRPPDLAVMTFDVTAGTYDIHSVTLATGETESVYHGEAPPNPFLARRGTAFVGYEAPPGAVVLVESFTRFIGEPIPERELPRSANPILLDLRTGETTSLGPWESGR